MTFTRFVGIDWSGAKGDCHAGIAVATARAGSAGPVLVPPPGRAWSRTQVLGWLRELAGSGERALIGMDFSFAPPFVARGAYLPGTSAGETARAFWAYVDEACDDADLGAASFLERTHRPYFWLGASDGRKADFLHWRACEAVFNRQGGGKTSTVYDCVGAAQVAKASFAGMRLLHHLGPALGVWPFDGPPSSQGPVLVEIYTRLMLARAGGSGRKLRDAAALNVALATLESEPYVGDGWLSDHATDALVTAAALRRMADDPVLWHPLALTPEIARTEGWTFGVV